MTVVFVTDLKQKHRPTKDNAYRQDAIVHACIIQRPCFNPVQQSW